MQKKWKLTKKYGFKERCIVDFHGLLSDLVESLDAQTPDNATREWIARVRVATPHDAIAEWHATITAPMTRTHAKYVRAVTSITDAQTLVYHAIRYRDVTAVMACRNPLAPIDVASCTKALTDADRELFWRYLVDLSDMCFRWAETPIPHVPTSDAIAADIAARRRRAAGGGRGKDDGDGGATSNDDGVRGDAPAPSTTPSAVRGLTQGVDDLWEQMCRARGVQDASIDDALRTRVRESVRGDAEITGPSLAHHFPELGDAPYTPEQIAIAERMRNLVTMDDSIPPNMMRGIESVASRLVKDLQSGKCDLGSLDIESIGNQVIAGVSETDMGAFASNLDKIIPALERAHRQ